MKESEDGNRPVKTPYTQEQPKAEFAKDIKCLIIYDNIIFSLQKAGGISNYWAELIQRIKFKKYVLFFESINNNIFRKEIVFETKKEIGFSYTFLRYIPFTKKLPPKSIFHSSYYRTTFQKNILNIVTVYDFTYEYYGSGLAKNIHGAQKKLAINNADGIICISDNTKNDLFKFYPNVEKNKVQTIYISASEKFHKIIDIDKDLGLIKFNDLKEKNIILYVGDRKSSYKNFHLAVDVVSSLGDFILVSVGAGEITKEENELIVDKINDRFVHFLGISSEDLNLLFNISYCLLYPSIYEGFGIPILEAMRSGCPVISTNLSSIPEVSGDAGLLVGDVNVENFIFEIEKLKSPSFRQDIIEKGLLQAGKFTWDKCFNETLSFYEKMHERKFIK